MDYISQYAEFIAQNLPEWNHRKAKDDNEISLQKRRFLTSVAKINRDMPFLKQMEAFGRIIAQHVPDNHIELYDEKGRQLVAKKEPEYSPRAYNVAYKSNEELTELKLEDTRHFKMQNGQAQWMIATQNLNGKKTGIVAIPSFGGNTHLQKENRQKFVDVFFAEKEAQGWQNIIFDFRGNQGGDADVIKEIGERMCGKELSYADEYEAIDVHPINAKQAEILAAKREVAGPHQLHYEASTKDKFNGDVYILQDKWCASASEGAIWMLSQLPHSQTIGEQTSGCFAGSAPVRLPFDNGMLKIGTYYCARTKNGLSIKEKEGIPADVSISSADAFLKAQTLIEERADNRRTLRAQMLKFMQGKAM